MRYREETKEKTLRQKGCPAIFISLCISIDCNQPTSVRNATTTYLYVTYENALTNANPVYVH